MAWHQSGTWDGRPVEEVATIMAQLCYAINEREKFIGRGTYDDAWSPWKESYDDGGSGTPALEALTEWYVADGSQKTFPAAADMDGLRLDHVNISTNVTRMQDATQTLIETGHAENMGSYHTALETVFTDSAYTAYTTLAGVLTKGSYGTSWLTYERPHQARIWIQIKDALDELIYPRYRFYWNVPYYGATFATQYATRFEQGGQDSDEDIAWDDAKADSPSSINTGSTPPYAEWQKFQTTQFTFLIEQSTTEVFNTKYTVGSLRKGLLWTREAANIDSLDNTNSVDFLIDGGALTETPNLDDTAPASADVSYDQLTAWPTIGSQTTAVDVSITTAEPADDPFDVNSAGQARVSLLYGDAHTTILASLTYG